MSNVKTKPAAGGIDPGLIERMRDYAASCEDHAAFLETEFGLTGTARQLADDVAAVVRILEAMP